MSGRASSNDNRRRTTLQDTTQFDSEMTAYKVVMADCDGAPVACSGVLRVESEPYGMDESVVWLLLEDGRKLGLVSSTPQRFAEVSL